MRAGDDELHALLDGGDLRDAGTWLVNSYAHEVFGLCAAMVRDRNAAEDLAQDVFSRAFSGLGAYRREASSRTWLLAIARNRCIDHLRSNGRAPFTDAEPDEAPAPTPLPSDLLSRRTDVARALRELGEGERALVILRYRHGMSYDELGEVFGLKTGTARMRVNRALGRMRVALEMESAPAIGGYPAGAAAPIPDSLSSLDAFDEEGSAAGEVSAPEPQEAPRARKSRAGVRKSARGGLLGRIFGSKDRDEPAAPAVEEEAASDATTEAPPAPAPRYSAEADTPTGAPAPATSMSGAPDAGLAETLAALDPEAPRSFVQRLLDAARRL